MDDDIPLVNPYVLLTPGPLSTSRSVKAAMYRDWCTWDDDYKALVEDIRRRLIQLAGLDESTHTSVLMQGSGTFVVESVVGSALRPDGKLLVMANGVYGRRIAEIAERLKINCELRDSGEKNRPDISMLENTLQADKTITHVAMVHVETTTGMLNSLDRAANLCAAHGRSFIVDAMSSFGGIPTKWDEIGADFIISSANKCLQGVPGFGFVIAGREAMNRCAGNARSLSLDIYDQWKTMEEQKGKWRFTSPTHTVRAFHQALEELRGEGGVEARSKRYSENHRVLVEGMRGLGFRTLLPDELQSPIITSFFTPSPGSDWFDGFYSDLKNKGFVIYPGKVTGEDTFRVGSIGDIDRQVMERFIKAVGESGAG